MKLINNSVHIFAGVNKNKIAEKTTLYKMNYIYNNMFRVCETQCCWLWACLGMFKARSNSLKFT